MSYEIIDLYGKSLISTYEVSFYVFLRLKIYFTHLISWCKNNYCSNWLCLYRYTIGLFLDITLIVVITHSDVWKDIQFILIIRVSDTFVFKMTDRLLRSRRWTNPYLSPM